MIKTMMLIMMMIMMMLMRNKEGGRAVDDQKEEKSPIGVTDCKPLHHPCHHLMDHDKDE